MGQNGLSPVSSILISQPKPDERSPYYDLARRYGVRLDFRKFIHVEEVPGKDFRKLRITPTDFSAVILTSRNAIDHFFRICDDIRVKMSQETKFFCTSEAIAMYLQKYTQYRKRKVFFGNGSVQDFLSIVKKHKEGNDFLFPCSDKHKKDIPDFLTANGFSWKEAVIYKTVASDLSDLKEINYDMIVFFSPSGVESLFQNFPDFKQNKTRIAAFGPTTSKAVEDAGLTLNVKAPIPKAPSMMMALDQYLESANAKS